MQWLKNIEQRIWRQEHSGRFYRWLRLLLAVWHVVSQSQIKLFAASLTYQTLLAIVPVLAVLFTLMKSFGIEKFLNRMVFNLLAPMGAAGKEVGDYLFQFINNAQAGYLGGVGLLFLFYSVFTLFSKIELALNHLWYVDVHRHPAKQAMNYLGVMMLVVLVASLALGLNVLVHQGVFIREWGDMPMIATATTIIVKLLSIMVTAVMLAVLYIGAINIAVSPRAAFIGGLFCAVAWLPLTSIFAKLMSLSTSYSVIYSGFAGLVILLVWLHVLWLLFLSGSLVAYFVQFPALLRPAGAKPLNPAEMEHFALLLIKHIVARFQARQGAVKLNELMDISELSRRQVLTILKPFLKAKMIVVLGRDNNDYLPGVGENHLGDDAILTTIRGKVR